MSKKKNRHEVTDLIKREKYTYSRETSRSETGDIAEGGRGLLYEGSQPSSEFLLLI